MVLNYQKTIAGAFRDVSNALIALNKQRAYREQQEKLVAAAKDATRLARIRYQGGATGYLEVLTTDTNLFAAQLEPGPAQQGEALTPGAALQRAGRRVARLRELLRFPALASIDSLVERAEHSWGRVDVATARDTRDAFRIGQAIQISMVSRRTARSCAQCRNNGRCADQEFS